MAAKPGPAGGLQPRTVNLHLAAANGYLRWCGRPDLLLRHVQAPAAEGPQLTRPEYLRLLRTARRKGWRRLYLLVKLFAHHRAAAAGF